MVSRRNVTFDVTFASTAVIIVPTGTKIFSFTSVAFYKYTNKNRLAIKNFLNFWYVAISLNKYPFKFRWWFLILILLGIISLFCVRINYYYPILNSINISNTSELLIFDYHISTLAIFDLAFKLLLVLSLIYSNYLLFLLLINFYNGIKIYTNFESLHFIKNFNLSQRKLIFRLYYFNLSYIFLINCFIIFLLYSTISLLNIPYLSVIYFTILSINFLFSIYFYRNKYISIWSFTDYKLKVPKYFIFFIFFAFFSYVTGFILIRTGFLFYLLHNKLNILNVVYCSDSTNSDDWGVISTDFWNISEWNEQISDMCLQKRQEEKSVFSGDKYLYTTFNRYYIIENKNLNFNINTNKIYPQNSVSKIVEDNLLKGGYIKNTNSTFSEYTSFSFRDLITVIFPHDGFRGIANKGPWSQNFRFENFRYEQIGQSHVDSAPKGYIKHKPSHWEDNKYIFQQNLIEHQLNNVSSYNENAFVFGNDHFEYLTCSLSIISINAPIGERGFYSIEDFHKLHFYINSQPLDPIIRYDFNTNLTNIVYQIKQTGNFIDYPDGSSFMLTKDKFFESILKTKGYWTNVFYIDFEFFTSLNKLNYNFNCAYPNYKELPPLSDNELNPSFEDYYRRYPENQDNSQTKEDYIPYIKISNDMLPVSFKRETRIKVLNALAESKLTKNDTTLLASATHIGTNYNKEILFNNIKEKVIISNEGKVQIVQVFA